MAAHAQPAGQPMHAASYPPPTIYANPYAPRPRVQRNLQSMAILWFVYAAYRVVAGLIGMVVLRAFTMQSFSDGFPFSHHYMHGDTPAWMAVLAPIVAAYTLLSVALAIFVGWSLLNRKPWGRTLAIVAAVLALLKLPMGTALGIYTLWVLAPGASGMEWEAIADRS